MTEQTLVRARGGEEDSFRLLTDPYRRELQLHIYRIVGSAQDAEDLLQETFAGSGRSPGKHELCGDRGPWRRCRLHARVRS